MTEQRKVLHDRLDEEELRKIRASSIVENEERGLEARQVIRDILDHPKTEYREGGDIVDFKALAEEQEVSEGEIKAKIARANAILTACNETNLAKTQCKSWQQAAASGVVGQEEQWAAASAGMDVHMPLIRALEEKHGLQAKGDDGLREIKTFLEHKEYMSQTGDLNDIVAATMVRSGGTGNTPTGITPDRPYSTQMPFEVVDKRRGLVDILPKFPVTNDTFKYLYEPLTAASATPVPNYMVAENTAAVQQDVGLVEGSVTIRDVRGMVTVSRQQLADVPFARAYASHILARQAADVVENQGLNGNGTGENLQGLYGLTGKLTKGRTVNDTKNVTTFYAEALSAYGEPRGTGAGTMPTHLLTSNSQFYKLMSAVATDGHYLHGDPVTGAVNTIWGIPIAVGDFHPAEKGLLINADPRYILWITRQGIGITTGLNGTDFSAYRISMMIVTRCALAVPRPETVMELTNLDGNAA